MDSVDVRTLVLTASAAAAATSLLFGVIAWRRAAAELRLWAAAFGLKALGLALIYLRGRIPAVVSLPLANALIVAAMHALLLGLDRFAGRARLRRRVATLVPMVAALFATYYLGSYDQLTTVLSTLLAALSLSAAAQVVRLPAPGMRAERAALLLMFGHEGVLFVVRALTYAFGARHETLFTPTPGTILLYFTVVLAPMLLGPALLALLTRREQLDKEQLIRELTATLAEVRTLRGLLPICAGCKQIRDDDGRWSSVEAYVTHHSEAQFTHSICPGCAARLYPELDVA